MTLQPIVSDASSLIALQQIGQLDLLRQLFDLVVVPPAVTREVAPTLTLPNWIKEKSLVDAIRPYILSALLGRGESEAICLALELQARLIILDDRPARRLAEALHIPVIGTLGILLTAKRRHLLPALRPLLDALLQHQFRISQRLYEQVLADTGESLS